MHKIAIEDVYHRELSSVPTGNPVGWDGGGGRREVQEGGDTCMLLLLFSRQVMSDSSRPREL